MKNKLKKSKIIVPALALITATTVASVTGTVAWFTASRQINVSASHFQTTTLNSNLTVECEGYGTTDTAATTDKNGITFSGSLTHGSYNAQALQTSGDAKGKTATNANLFTPTMDSSSVTGYVSQGRVEEQHTDAQYDTDKTTIKTPETNKWKAGVSGSTNIWYAVAWKMTFKQEANKDSGTNVNTLHFDPKQSTFTKNSGDSDGDTINGFRIALMTETQFYVAAGDSQSTHVKQVTSSTVATNQAEEKFNPTNFVDVTSSQFAQPADDTKTNLETTSNYYLGEIDATNGLTVIAVAWYEGCDTNIVTTKNDGSATVMSDVKANLCFFSRKATA